MPGSDVWSRKPTSYVAPLFKQSNKNRSACRGLRSLQTYAVHQSIRAVYVSSEADKRRHQLLFECSSWNIESIPISTSSPTQLSSVIMPYPNFILSCLFVLLIGPASILARPPHREFLTENNPLIKRLNDNDGRDPSNAIDVVIDCTNQPDNCEQNCYAIHCKGVTRIL